MCKPSLLPVPLWPLLAAAFFLTSCSANTKLNSLAGASPVSSDPAGSTGNSTSHVYAVTYGQTAQGQAPGGTHGYSVAQNGQLTPIPGFPVSTKIDGAIVSGSYFFVGNPDGVHIDTYLIHSDGTFSKVQSFDDTQTSNAACSHCTPGQPVLTDRSGSNLYVTAGWLDGGDYDSYLQTFSIDKATGAIRYVSSNMQVSARDWGLEFGWFSGNGSFLYGNNVNPFYAGIRFEVRAPGGSLAAPSGVSQIISGLAPPPGGYYESMVIGTDTTNHLAAGIQYYDSTGNFPASLQLASFTINSDGTLTTANSNAEMPVAPSWNGTVSPDGTLIAMEGKNGGIQIFNFHGAAPITANTGMFPTDPIAQLAWDNHNHLFALSQSQKLYVFNVTSANTSPAPGSPYSIPNAIALVVQP